MGLSASAVHMRQIMHGILLMHCLHTQSIEGLFLLLRSLIVEALQSIAFVWFDIMQRFVSSASYWHMSPMLSWPIR